MVKISDYEFIVLQELIKKGYKFKDQYDFKWHYSYWKNKKIIESHNDPKIYAYRIDRFEKNIINVNPTR